jgi:adenosylhomocysteinase
MKDGAIVANSGHFNVEIDTLALKKISKKIRHIRDSVEEFTLKDNRKIYLLGEGRLINLASAEGHPPSVMDMSFANQALSAEYAVKKAHTLSKKVYVVPKHIDEKIAHLKLKSMGIRIDVLNKQQQQYLKSWELGT